MRALVVDPPGRLKLSNVEEPALASRECRVRVTLAGICRTDLELVKGYMGFTGVPGHEFVGVVTQGPERLLNRRVVGEINAACGDCSSCRAGLARHCANRTVLGIFKRPGAFAETLTLPEENLLAVPDSVPDEEAVFTEPLAAALEIFEQVHVAPGSRMLVIGDGKLGLLIAQVCAHMGARVTLSGRHEKKLALARRWNIEALTACDLVSRPREKFPYVVECTGTPGALNDAMNLIAPRGALILKSTYAPAHPPQIDWAKIVIDEISVVGSRCGQFAPSLRLLASGKIDVRSLIDHRKTLDQGVDAFELAAQKGVLKVLLRV